MFAPQKIAVSPPKNLILGIDPGLSSTGWGVIEQSPNKLFYVASGLIQTSAKHSLAQRLAQLFEGLTQVLQDYCPHHVAIEEVFVNKNPESSLKLAMARGVILCAPARLNLSLTSYTANHVKKALVGFGHAEKKQVAWAVQQILKLSLLPQKDAADALGVAICHANTGGLHSFFG